MPQGGPTSATNLEYTPAEPPDCLAGSTVYAQHASVITALFETTK